MAANSYFRISPRPSPLAPRPVRSGVTLLELILALGLSIIVMGLISMAISLNFRMYDAKRSSVEESQLARSLLRHIADDIRAAVQPMPPDLSGLEVVAGNTELAGNVLSGSAMGALGSALGQGGQGSGQGANAQSGGAGAAQGAGQNGSGNSANGGTGTGGTGGTGGANPLGGSTFGVEPQTQEAASTYGEEQGASIIGLYGSSTELQLDISRLPRVDQYQTEFSADGINQVVDIPSDMKTVSYYLGAEDGTGSVIGGGLTGFDVRGRGLYRHTLDRAVSTYAMQSGNTSGTIGKTDLLADEVIGLQFMYFDGSGWTEEWDSSAMEGLPVAIEITLILGDAQTKTATTSLNSFASSTTEEENERYYTLTVNLPTALTADEKAQAKQAEETALSQTGALDTSGDAAEAGAGGAGLGGGPGGNQGGGQGSGDGRDGRGPGSGGQGGPGPGGQGPGGQGPGGQGPGQGPGGGMGGQGPGGGQGGMGGGRGGMGGGRGGMGGGPGGGRGGMGGPGGGRGGMGGGMGGGRGR